MQKNDSRICKKTYFSFNTCITKAGRRIFFLLAVLVISTQLFAYSGMLAGEKKLLVAKTKWFDIIYPERCKESAEILFNRADDLYEEVTAQYGLSPAFRMPVVITPAVDEFNAFWTAVPYNHIAIYDTGDSGAGGLAVFSETLLSTFRHELTHAVTYNMKNGFWRGLDKVFGDCVAPGMLTVTTGMAEGATVTSESAGGEGRLNDEYAKHYVKQAKIENQFPSYHDVSGAADVMPSGAPYYFNGAFHQWLQEEYGMAAYAEFWYRVVNGKSLTISGAFKKVYGIKLKAAWKQFENDYQVPKLAANPVKAGLVQDFFEPSEQDYSQLNNAGSCYSSLTTAAGRLVWLDRFGGRVFTADDSASASDVGSVKIRELFSLRGLSGVRLSNDGRFIVASYYSENAAQEKARVKIYDFENGSLYSVKEKGLKDASVVKSGSGWFLLAQKYLNQHYTIVVYKLLLGENKDHIRGIEPYSELTFDPEINPFAFTPLEDGSFAWLKKNRLSYSLCISSVEGELLSQYDFPDGMVVHSLSFNEKDNNTFYFSYAQKGTLPRLGKVNAAFDEISLSTKDISGGVFEPLYWDGKVVYIGEFFRQSRLLTMQATTLRGAGSEKRRQTNPNFEDSVSQEDAEEIEENLSEDFFIPETAITLDISQYSRPYNPFPYLIHGILIPYADYQTDFLGPDVEKAATAQSLFLGASYITANPWTDGGADLYTLAAGWDIYSNTFGTSFTVNKGTSTSLLRSQTQLKSEFNKNGWKQSGINLGLSSAFRLGNVSQIAVSNTASGFLGQKGELFYSLSDVASVQFSTIRRAGPGRFENKGFALAVSYGRWYDASLTGPLLCYVDESALAAGVKACIPRLLPFESSYGYTFNLPLTVSFSLLPASSIYGYAFLGNKEERISPGKPVFDALAEATVFSMEIQKAIPWLTALYLNDFSAALGYAATGAAGIATKDGFQTANLGEYFPAIADGRGYYLDSVYVRANLEFTPNIGVFANSAYKMKLFGIYSYTLHTVKELKAEERINLSIGLDLNLP